MNGLIFSLFQSSAPILCIHHTTNMSFMQKFVRNEAAKNDPLEVYNGRALAISLIVRTQHIRKVHPKLMHCRHAAVRSFSVWTWGSSGAFLSCRLSRSTPWFPSIRTLDKSTPRADKEYREYGLLGKGEAEKASLSSNIVSVLQAGAFLGALAAMWLANRIGRRWSLIVASLLIFIGVAMQAGASGIMAVMYIGR